jgi:hypothetical protein
LKLSIATRVNRELRQLSAESIPERPAISPDLSFSAPEKVVRIVRAS